jgi:hypothetical protein
MAAAPDPTSIPSGGSTRARRTRPLCREYGGDPRSVQLAESIAGHQRVISEHEGAMLQEIAEFAAAQAWRGDGSLSMADWLVARLHVSRTRARRLVEAAEKTEQLPALCGALSEGRLTLEVFAPLAAVATPATDADLAQAAEHWTPRQARQLAAEVKGATDADSAARFQRRFVRFDDERCLLWAQLTKDAYALLKSAVVGRARRHDHPSASDPDYVRFETRCADALVDLCLERGTPKRGSSPRTTTTTMIVHTDLDRLLYGDGYGHASIQGVGPISAEVARRLACNADITLSFDAPDGTCLDQKPLQRDPTDAQRIEIRRRDNGCRFPGCGCRNVTDVHHVVWASKQGPTILSNLLTLCVGHHSRVHELGWKLDGDAQHAVRFISPQGRVFVSTPSPSWRPPPRK